MTRRVKTRGGSLIAALRSAIAELAQTDDSKVDVTIDAPGFDAGIEGDVKVRLELKDVVERRDEPDELAELAEPDELAEPGSPVESGAPVAQADEGAGPADDRDQDEAEQREDDEDRDQRASAAIGAPSDGQDGITVEELDEEADAAADFLEGLLDAIGLPGDLQIRVHEDHAEVEIVNVGSGALIGRRGSTLEALQELVRSVLQRQFERRSRVQIDIEGYRARRLERLLEKAESAIDEVLDTGEAVRLEPMDVFERKKVHHLVAEVEGVTSRSQGREPGRRVIIEPDED